MLPQSRQLRTWRTCTIPSPQALAEALKTNGSVTEIFLGSNRIGDEGAKARSATECSKVTSPQALAKPKAWSGAQKPKAPSVFSTTSFQTCQTASEGFGFRLQGLGSGFGAESLQDYRAFLGSQMLFSDGIIVC